MNNISIPEQVSGSKSDTSDHITCDSIPEASNLFSRSAGRLKNVNGWHEIAGKATANFQLTDATGAPLERTVEVGDLFRIELPVTENEKGGGYDWVRVEEFEEHFDPKGESEYVYFRVRPCANPMEASDATAHFFDEKATSTFLVQRKDGTVSAAVHGRNEHANTEGEGMIDKARNLIVAVGAKLGLSTPQWAALVKGVLDK